MTDKDMFDNDTKLFFNHGYYDNLAVVSARPPGWRITL